MARSKSSLETAVVDTMIFAYALLGVTRYRDEAARVLEAVRAIVVPDTLHAELTNVVWQWLRPEKLGLDIGTDCLRDAAALITAVESAETIWERALTLAVESKHPAYDMMFVALAEKLDAPLITYDQKLAQLLPKVAFLPGSMLAGV